MSSSRIPAATQILVIGGGPAGSYAASALAREGFEVVLLESAKFPRYHIGESLLPSVLPYLEIIGALDKVRQWGFCRKPGAAMKFTQHKREGYTDFSRLDGLDATWNVTRADFDNLLLRHSEECGAKVYEQVSVTSITFADGGISGRPVSAQYEDRSEKEARKGTIEFSYVIDASGRTGILSTKYFKNRKINKSLINTAIWGYWKGCNRYGAGTTRENAIWVEALTDETGWTWFIPLHDGTVSVGVVQDLSKSVEKKAALRESSNNPDMTLRDFYLDEIKRSPGTVEYIGQGELIDVGKDGGLAVKQASDQSYSAEGYAGPGYRIIGDAAAFIDPFFSSGVHMALTGGLSAAATIASSIRGETTEENAAKWHENKVGVAYTRFLMVVLGAYKQMGAQNMDVLSDVNSDNFDRAFEVLRPVLQGGADINRELSKDEILQTMDFVKNVLAPTSPEMHAAVQAQVGDKLFTEDGKVLLEEDLNSMFVDEDTKHVLREINARKPIHKMYDSHKDFGTEAFQGYTICMDQGMLGMIKTVA